MVLRYITSIIPFFLIFFIVDTAKYNTTPNSSSIASDTVLLNANNEEYFNYYSDENTTDAIATFANNFLDYSQPKIKTLNLSKTNETIMELNNKDSTNQSLILVSQVGTHAYLPCNVKQFTKKPISWIRQRDGHILTVDQTTFIADQRFLSIYTEEPSSWALQIKYVQSKDTGWYECQVSTEAKSSAKIYLDVIEPETKILGELNRHVKAGSLVKIRCIISELLEPPLYINWLFNNKQIYFQNKRQWKTEIEREMIKNKSTQNTIASLIIPSVNKRDSGNYTCKPSNSKSASVQLHVLNGEYSASAITSGGSNNINLFKKNQHNYYNTSFSQNLILIVNFSWFLLNGKILII